MEKQNGLQPRARGEEQDISTIEPAPEVVEYSPPPLSPADEGVNPETTAAQTEASRAPRRIRRRRGHRVWPADNWGSLPPRRTPNEVNYRWLRNYIAERNRVERECMHQEHEDFQQLQQTRQQQYEHHLQMTELMREQLTQTRRLADMLEQFLQKLVAIHAPTGSTD